MKRQSLTCVKLEAEYFPCIFFVVLYTNCCLFFGIYLTQCSQCVELGGITKRRMTRRWPFIKERSSPMLSKATGVGKSLRNVLIISLIILVNTWNKFHISAQPCIYIYILYSVYSFSVFHIPVLLILYL